MKEVPRNQCPRCKKQTPHIFRLRMKFWCRVCHIIFGSVNNTPRKTYARTVFKGKDMGYRVDYRTDSYNGGDRYLVPIMVGDEKIELSPEQIEYRKRHREGLLAKRRKILTE